MAAVSDGKLNNPFFTYPAYPFKGYLDFKTYRREVVRFTEYMNSLEFKENDLFVLCIGAAMEEMTCDDTYTRYSHWRQLFPVSIEDFCTEEKGHLKMAIVSPNHSFSEEEFCDPVFIKMTDGDFKWVKEGRSYRSSVYNVVINIFCCPFPHAEKDKNKSQYNLIMKNCSKEVDLTAYAEDMLQTDTDVAFVEQFYKDLEKCFQKVYVIVLSYAVFNESIMDNKFNNYALFSEILGLFPKGVKNRELYRWKFEKTNTKMIPYMNNNNIKQFDYLTH
jgi:hypothetical protein